MSLEQLEEAIDGAGNGISPSAEPHLSEVAAKHRAAVTANAVSNARGKSNRHCGDCSPRFAFYRNSDHGRSCRDFESLWLIERLV